MKFESEDNFFFFVAMRAINKSLKISRRFGNEIFEQNLVVFSSESSSTGRQEEASLERKKICGTITFSRVTVPRVTRFFYNAEADNRCVY